MRKNNPTEVRTQPRSNAGFFLSSIIPEIAPLVNRFGKTQEKLWKITEILLDLVSNFISSKLAKFQMH